VVGSGVVTHPIGLPAPANSVPPKKHTKVTIAANQSLVLTPSRKTHSGWKKTSWMSSSSPRASSGCVSVLLNDCQ
jgi:hypothetical protein